MYFGNNLLIHISHTYVMITYNIFIQQGIILNVLFCFLFIFYADLDIFFESATEIPGKDGRFVQSDGSLLGKNIYEQ
jgi:hypothetical protein